MGEIDRREVATVALLAVGILLFANPAYTQGQGGGPSAAEVAVGQEIQPSELGPGSVAQLRGNATVVPVVEYERLNNESRSIFDTGRQGVYLIRDESDAGEAVLRSAVLYGDRIYLRQTQQTQRGVELTYVDRSDDIEENFIGTSLMSDEQRGAFRNATDGGGVSLTATDRGLSAYDYVYDNETSTYYETSTERRENATVLTAEEMGIRSLIDSRFTQTDEMDDEVREAVVAGIDGERPVVTGDVLSGLRSSQLVRHDGAYYQLQLGQAQPPIDEALGPVNFAGMGAGVLLIAGGVYVARRVFLERTREERNWRIEE